MKIRTLLSTLMMASVLTVNLSAKPVDQPTARSAAYQFMLERIKSGQVNWNASDVVLSNGRVLSIDGQPALYAFNLQPAGFILMSADDALAPVFGYSYEGRFPDQGLNPNYDSYLNTYVYQVKYVRDQGIQATPEVTESWTTLNGAQAQKSLLATNEVLPLLSIMWNQDYPYNYYCPVDASGPGGHVYAGCVATAMSMIMYYYRYPITGSGTHSYYASGYGTQTANFGATTYDWDLMLNSVSPTNGLNFPAVALLQYQAGVSVNMNYSPTGSGAYSTDVAGALKTYFKYSSGTTYSARSGYTATQWENLLLEQLDALQPVYYSGTDPTPVTGGGHAFVCDGYQTTTSGKEFHFNFGWSGSGNGYYTTANPNGFTTQQAIVRNIIPQTSSYPYGCTTATFTSLKGSFEDGSGPIDFYANDLACSYLITLDDTIAKIKFTLNRLDLAAGDTLYCYDGPDDSYPLIGAFSGSTLPADVYSTGKRMFIQFITDNNTGSQGWAGEYSGVLANVCPGTMTYTAASGVLSDGSGDLYNYQNNQICKYKIQPAYATDITLFFTQFDLVDGDVLKVYSLTPSVLLGEYTGNNIPDPLTVPTGGFYIIFQTDEMNTATGFEAVYTIGNASTGSVPGISDFMISPNPASDYVKMNAIARKDLAIHINITDVLGNSVLSSEETLHSGAFEKLLDVSKLRKGVYNFTISSPEGQSTKKLVIR